MKVVFMGTPQFAVPVLEEIIKAGHEVLAVFTQPDKPKGRGKTVSISAVREYALAHKLPVHQPVKIKDEQTVTLLRQYEADIFVVAAFGQILSKEILSIPTYGCINVHASLLPKYRGAAPVQWAILKGEEESGVTIMQMDEGVDTGDMILKQAVPIEKEETGRTLTDKLSILGARLCVEAMSLIEKDQVIREKQDNEKSSYAKMLTKTMGRVEWTKKAVEIERLIRALNPWPSAYSYFKGKTIKLWQAEAVTDTVNGAIGEIVKIEKDSILVQTGEGALALKEIQLEGKKRMAADAFLRGTNMQAGEKFE